jgi:hypothetical protein
MLSLRSTLDALASNFATAVLDAIRGASIHDLLAETGGALRRGPGRPRASASGQSTGKRQHSPVDPGPGPSPSPKPSPKLKGGRLARRSPADIARALDAVVILVRKSKTGMRSEEIRKALKLDVREVPRVLKEGLKKKVLKSKGQKRATVHSVS